jgi:Replication protein C C-terminal region
MGRELAAVALAIVSTKEVAHFQTSPAGYCHGMVVKARAGKLHLERTVWALRGVSEPEYHRAGRAGGLDRAETGREHCHHGRLVTASGSGSSICRLLYDPLRHFGDSAIASVQIAAHPDLWRRRGRTGLGSRQFCGSALCVEAEIGARTTSARWISRNPPLPLLAMSPDRAA